MEKGSPAKACGGSWLGQKYTIKRINTGHYPSASQAHSPDALKAFHVTLSSLLNPQHRVRYLALNNADSAVITVKDTELH